MIARMTKIGDDDYHVVVITNTPDSSPLTWICKNGELIDLNENEAEPNIHYFNSFRWAKSELCKKFTIVRKIPHRKIVYEVLVKFQ
jgi:hypothetical protein